MSYAEFWDTTPIELEDLLEQYTVKQDLENFRVGMICATLANLKRDPDKVPDPFTPEHFFRRLSDPIPEDPKVSPEVQAAEVIDEFWAQINESRAKTGKKIKAIKKAQCPVEMT